MDRTCSIKMLDFGSLKALVSVTIDKMEIRGFRVIDQGDGNPWVAAPSREVVRDSAREFYNIVRFTDQDARMEFNNWILKCYQEEKNRV